MKPNLYIFRLWIVITLTGVVFGVPANDKVWTFTQPDGTTFQAVLHGDEYYSYHQTLDGEVILQDRGTGVWFYAEPRADGTLQTTTARVGQDRFLIGDLNRERSQWLKAVHEAGDRKASEIQSDSGLKKAPAKGALKGILLLADFNDTLATYSQTTFNSLMNTTGYTSNNALGSVKDYYFEVSYGQLTLLTDVSAWVKLPKPHDYYGKDDPISGPKDINTREMIKDAIAAADPAVNFADYDSDGDGWVDMFGVVHQGLGQEVTGRDSNYIWSHRGYLSQPVIVDGVRIQEYYTVPELNDGTQLTTIGVFCHEMGHFLGVPDLYDYDRTSVGVGDWSIMGSGSWLGPNNSRNGAKPCHFDPWCKYMLGWITPQVIYTQQSVISLPGFDTHPTALLIPVDPYQDGEYFLVANRYRRAASSAATGFDEYLPGSGVLILHVDDYAPNNDDETRKKVDVEEADGLASLDMSLVENNYNKGDAGDLYPNGGPMLSDSTNPDSRDNDGVSTGIAVYGFTGAGTDMMTCDITPRAQLEGYTILYDSIGNDRNYSRGYDDDDYACVRFVSEQGGVLERVKTHFVYEGTTDYTISIYSEWLDNNKPTGLLTRQSGSHTGNSYEEIFLSEPQTFDKGAEFVVEIRYNTRGKYFGPLPMVDDGDCSERTYIRSNDTASYFQYTKAKDRPYDALIRAGMRAPSPSGSTLPADLEVVTNATYPSTDDLAPGSEKAQERQRQAVQELGLPLEVKTRQTGIVFRLVPAGTFTMGSPTSEAGRYGDEGPQHQVTLTKPFYCSKFEVTQGQWQQVMGSSPANFRSAGVDAPVESVRWDDCQTFLAMLCQKEGVPNGTYRLLTEAEWEYACRSGTVSAYCFGNSESALGQYAWYSGNSDNQTHLLGQKQANAFGLYDMHGNVWEWCQDWYADYADGWHLDPLGPVSGVNRISRGGSWIDGAGYCRSAYRNKNTPGSGYTNLGLRLARTLFTESPGKTASIVGTWQAIRQ